MSETQNITEIINANLIHQRRVVDNPDIYALSTELHELFTQKGQSVSHYIRAENNWSLHEKVYVNYHIQYALQIEGCTHVTPPKEIGDGGILLLFSTKGLEKSQSLGVGDYDNLKDHQIEFPISVNRSPHVILLPGTGIYVAQSNYNCSSFRNRPSFAHFDEHFFLTENGSLL
jgi:hypothetical protein